MILTDTLIKKIEETGFSVDHEEGNIYYFGKFSSAGQDFGFPLIQKILLKHSQITCLIITTTLTYHMKRICGLMNLDTEEMAHRMT